MNEKEKNQNKTLDYGKFESEVSQENHSQEHKDIPNYKTELNLQMNQEYSGINNKEENNLINNQSQLNDSNNKSQLKTPEAKLSSSEISNNNIEFNKLKTSNESSKMIKYKINFNKGDKISKKKPPCISLQNNNDQNNIINNNICVNVNFNNYCSNDKLNKEFTMQKNNLQEDLNKTTTGSAISEIVINKDDMSIHLDSLSKRVKADQNLIMNESINSKADLENHKYRSGDPGKIIRRSLIKQCILIIAVIFILILIVYFLLRSL